MYLLKINHEFVKKFETLAEAYSYITYKRLEYNEYELHKESLENGIKTYNRVI